MDPQLLRPHSEMSREKRKAAQKIDLSMLVAAMQCRLIFLDESM
jgi:hypothetical protein